MAWRSSASSVAEPCSRSACTRCSATCSTSDVPLGFVDISFYRDDLQKRSDTPQVHATRVDFPIDGATVVIVDDVLFTGRTVRAAIDALFDFGRPAQGPARGARRPRPPRAADPAGLRRQEPPDRTLGARQRPRERARRRGQGRDRGRMNHLISIADLDRAAIERLCDRAAAFEEVGERDIKKVPGAARADRAEPLLRGEHAHADLVRARRQAAERRRRQLRRLRLVGREGRVAQGHRADDDRPQARRDRDPLPLGRAPPRCCRAGRRRRSSTPATASTSTRRRRCSTSTRCGAGWARSRARRSGSSATSCTRASRARTSWPSRRWARRSRSPGRRR